MHYYHFGRQFDLKGMDYGLICRINSIIGKS